MAKRLRANKKNIDAGTRHAFDNYDHLVEMLTRKDALHDKVGIAYQTLAKTKNWCNASQEWESNYWFQCSINDLRKRSIIFFCFLISSFAMANFIFLQSSYIHNEWSQFQTSGFFEYFFFNLFYKFSLKRETKNIQEDFQQWLIIN